MYSIRRATDSDWHAIEAINMRSFGKHEPQQMWDNHKKEITAHRFFLAVDDASGDVVGTAAFFPSSVNIAGMIVPMAAVTEVTVAATHRRMGILHALFDTMHKDAEFRTFPISGLTASQATIYPRYGYGPAAFAHHYELDMTRAALAVKPSTADTVRYSTVENATEQMKDIYTRWQAVTPGAVARSNSRWVMQLAYPTDIKTEEAHVLLHEDGYVRFNYRGGDDYPELIEVQEFKAVTNEARQALWKVITGHDIAPKLTIEGTHNSALKLMLRDIRGMHSTGEHDTLWLRVNDVETVLSALTPQGKGNIVLNITDPYLETSGCFELSYADGAAHCNLSSKTAKLSMSLDTLGSLITGAISASDALSAGKILCNADAARQLSHAVYADTTPEIGTYF